MIQIKGVADTEVKTQGVQLGYRPDGVEGQVWSNNHVVLGTGSYDGGTKRSQHDSSAIIRIIDVVVVLDTNCCAHSKSNWAQEQIIRNAGNILLPGIRSLLAGQRRAYRVLRINTLSRDQHRRHEQKHDRFPQLIAVQGAETTTHRQVDQIRVQAEVPFKNPKPVTQRFSNARLPSKILSSYLVISFSGRFFYEKTILGSKRNRRKLYTVS